MVIPHTMGRSLSRHTVHRVWNRGERRIGQGMLPCHDALVVMRSHWSVSALSHGITVCLQLTGFHMEISTARIWCSLVLCMAVRIKTWLSYSWHSIHHSIHRLRGNGQREEWEETLQRRWRPMVGGCMGCKTTQDYITFITLTQCVQ